MLTIIPLFLLEISCGLREVLGGGGGGRKLPEGGRGPAVDDEELCPRVAAGAMEPVEPVFGGGREVFLPGRAFGGAGASEGILLPLLSDLDRCTGSRGLGPGLSITAGAAGFRTALGFTPLDL